MGVIKRLFHVCDKYYSNFMPYFYASMQDAQRKGNS